MVNGVHPVQRAPAPWTMRAESYLLLLRLKELPEGLYDELEEAWGDEGLGRFEGGLGAVMIVRYADTPVGRLHYLFSTCFVSSIVKCIVSLRSGNKLGPFVIGSPFSFAIQSSLKE